MAIEIGLGGTGQLQCHQEVRRLPDARRQAVLHRNDGRASGTGAKRDVVEAELEGLVDAERPAETDAADHGELAAALQQQPDHLQEVSCPSEP